MEPYSQQNWAETRKDLKRFVYRKVRDRDTAEDIVQDVFVKALTKSHQLQDEQKAKGWMFRIARNEVVDYFRKRKDVGALPEVDSATDHSPLSECVTQCLGNMLGTLPSKYRDALTADVAGMPQTELAQKLNISYSGAKSRVQRARSILREKMEARYRLEMDSYGNVIVCRDKSTSDCSC